MAEDQGLGLDVDADGTVDFLVEDTDFDGYADSVITDSGAELATPDAPTADVEDAGAVDEGGSATYFGDGGDAIFTNADGSVSFAGTTAGGDSISFDSDIGAVDYTPAFDPGVDF
jgi:hypothetical protein